MPEQNQTPTLIGIAHLHFERHWEMLLHRHSGFHEMLVMTEGHIEAAVQNSVIEGRPGSVIVYPDAVPHQEKALDGKPVRMYCLTWKGEPVALPTVSTDRQGRLIMLLRWMQEIFPARAPREEEILRVLLQAVIYELSQGSGHAPSDLVLAVKRHVLAHLTESLHLEDLAAVVCLSKYRFAHLFREASGQAPMEYVRQIRVETARTLLLTSRLPLRAIAAQVGFSDEFHLSRAFRRATGIPPGQVRSQRDKTA